MTSRFKPCVGESDAMRGDDVRADVDVDVDVVVDVDVDVERARTLLTTTTTHDDDDDDDDDDGWWWWLCDGERRAHARTRCRV